LQDNKALNGQFDPALRYDSVPGYFYANHKTFIQEGALEFKINFPRFEQNTHLILHFWGGIGIGKYKTWIDAKDKNGNMYDFSGLKGQNVSQSDLSRTFDGSYETLAEGSGTNGTFRVIPSAGIGFGVRLSKYVAIVLEHKVSFPMTDELDGFKYSGSGSCVNDFYHYTAVNLIFTVHAKSGTSTSTHTNTDPHVYTNTTGTTVTTNTTTAITTTTVPTNTVTTPTQTVTNVPKVYPPAVTITYPQNNFYSQYDNVSVSAQLTNVTSSQQIGITLNGYPLTHFSFNPSNGMLNFQSFLALGNNYFIVTGTNSAGSANDQVNVIFAPTATVVPTNTVTTTNPTTVTVHTNTVTSTPTITPTNTTAVTPTVTPTGTVTAHTPTVVSTGTTTVHTPTVVSTETTTVHTPTVVSTLTTTVHTPTMVTTNTVTTEVVPHHTVTPTGTPTLSATAGKPPVVQFINPPTNPFDEPRTSSDVSGSILNVDTKDQVTVTVNGAAAPFSFGLNNHMFSLTTPLADGKNTVVVTATNNYGSDSKSLVINHKSFKPPVIVISFPAASPFNTFNQNETVNGFVYQVNSASQINVTVNGNNSAFNFNPADNSLLINLPNLPQGATMVNITATNQGGTDTKSITFNYQSNNQQTGLGTGTGTTSTGPTRKPYIMMQNPQNDPFYTNNSSIHGQAKIMYIGGSSDVKVVYNGANVPFSFDATSKELSFDASLLQGMNVFLITAQNAYGITTQTVNISYSGVNSNPGGGPGNGGVNPNNGNGGNTPNQGGGIIKPNSGGGIIRPNTGGGVIKPNTGGGGLINPGKPNTIPSENKGEIKAEPKLQTPGNTQPNNTPRSVSPTVVPSQNGGGGRTIGGGGQ
jgi:hypothetical protein